MRANTTQMMRVHQRLRIKQSVIRSDVKRRAHYSGSMCVCMDVYLSSGAGGGCVEPEVSICTESALKYLYFFFYASLCQSAAFSILFVCAQFESFFFALCHSSARSAVFLPLWLKWDYPKKCGGKRVCVFSSFDVSFLFLLLSFSSSASSLFRSFSASCSVSESFYPSFSLFSSKRSRH